jgi:hypothetical protein
MVLDPADLKLVQMLARASIELGTLLVFQESGTLSKQAVCQHLAAKHLIALANWRIHSLAILRPMTLK